jgi:hypothetical protein
MIKLLPLLNALLVGAVVVEVFGSETLLMQASEARGMLLLEHSRS